MRFPPFVANILHEHVDPATRSLRSVFVVARRAPAGGFDAGGAKRVATFARHRHRQDTPAHWAGEQSAAIFNHFVQCPPKIGERLGCC